MPLSPLFRRHIGTTVLVAGVAALLAAAAAPAKPAASVRLLVKFQPQASATARAAALSRAGATAIKTVHGIDVRVVGVSANADLALARLESSPAVAFAEVDTVLLTGVVPAGAHPKGVIAL